jgi:hypothetical protein
MVNIVLDSAKAVHHGEPTLADLPANRLIEILRGSNVPRRVARCIERRLRFERELIAAWDKDTER